MKEDQVYYKVVCTAGGMLTSCSTKVPCSVVYVARTRVGSTLGPLLVFDSLYNVKVFFETYGYNNRAVWACSVGNPRPVGSLLISNENESAIKAFWRGEMPKTHTIKAPRGTVACDWVELIYEIDLQEVMDVLET